VKVVLDTNAYSDWLRTGVWGREIAGASEVLLPATVYGELAYGFACGNQERQNLQRLDGHLDHPNFRVSAVTSETALCYAELKRHLHLNGTSIPENDIWIGATCREHQAVLLTNDRHFERLPQLRLRWPDEPGLI